MEYALAKELKDAGFPQSNRVLRCDKEGLTYNSFTDAGLPRKDSDLDNVTYPSLSELIEACNPDKFDDFGFLRNLDRWEAYAFYVGHFDFPKRFEQEDGTNLVDLHSYSDSLEEAVAHLWLALNKK